jgi:hypothetical protein
MMASALGASCVNMILEEGVQSIFVSSMSCFCPSISIWWRKLPSGVGFSVFTVHFLTNLNEVSQLFSPKETQMILKITETRLYLVAEGSFPNSCRSKEEDGIRFLCRRHAVAPLFSKYQT